MQTIVVPVDFSDCSHGVTTRAACVARQVGARVVILHVADGDQGGGAAAAERLLPAYLPLVEAEGVPVEVVRRAGRVADTILSVADELGAYLIVMGTHGRHGLARALLGSIAEAVMRRSYVPVMTVRSQHQPDCTARSCAWCSSGIGEALEQARAERES